MSDQNKHIDRIFQESFKDFETQPSHEVWNNIEAQIKTKKKRILPLWFKTAGVAASLLLAFSLGYLLQPNPTNASTSVTNLNDDDANIEIQTQPNTQFEKANQLLNQLIEQTAFMTKTGVGFTSSVASNTASTQNNQLQNEMASNKPASFVLVDAASKEDNNQSESSLSAVLNDSLQHNFNLNEQTSAENEITSVEKSAEKKHQFDDLFDDNEITEVSTSSNKWFLKPVLSPIFNSGNNASSALGAEVADNQSSGDVSFSYGMQIGFQLNNKWSIRTGINQVNTSYTTQDVIYAPAASALMPEGSNSAYGLFGEEYYATSISTLEARIVTQEGSLSQQMNYIEIPLEIEYAILEGKFGISLTGGASTFLLTDNGLTMNTLQGRLQVGEAQNLSQTSFSTNVGVGINYKINQKLRFHVEPALKYQINTFQGSNLNFNPYFFGVYSGLQFQF